MLAFNSLRQQHRRFSHPYYGVVIAVDTDSSKCKVLVLGVLEGNTNQLPWAQVQNGFGSSNAGVVFSPRVGSKVFVTFPTGDANHPVIHPGYNTKPSEFTSPATQHGWQDDSGNFLKVDQTAQTFTLHLATGAEITVDANNKMTIKATDVCIQADDNVDIQAGGDVNIQAGGDVSTEGTNISNTAAAQLCNEAATINSESAGPHVITGTPIQLN